LDKETLVRRDIEVQGLVLDALSRARIPVTLCEWNSVDQLGESELVIATPWVDTRGLREANRRVLEALSVAGVYQSVPVRRLLVLSPHDPVVQTLEREVKIKTEGVIHIKREDQNHPTLGGHYSVIFAPFAGPGGAVPAKKIIGVEHLRQFFDSDLGISPEVFKPALDQLGRNGNASIRHVQLTHREAKKIGLA